MNEWKILPDDGGIRRNATMLAQLMITMMDHDGIVTVDPVALEVELAEDSDRIIDAVEQTILDWREGATRTLTPTYLNTLSLKKTRQAPAELGGKSDREYQPLPSRWRNRAPDLFDRCANLEIQHPLEQCHRSVRGPWAAGILSHRWND